jgi:glycerol-3-phosphate dehydrogenase
MNEPQTCDVLVIGGGATGAGVLRDLARRGLRGLLVERGDFGTGTSGRFHGLLHSGGRYAVKDPAAAAECIAENQVLRRIVPSAIEDTGGYFVATPDDPDDYVGKFQGACLKAGIDCEEVKLADAFHREPALNPKIRRVFRVPDGSIDGWELIAANLADARGLGSEAWLYHEVVGFELVGERIVSARVADVRSGSITAVHPRFVVAAAGAWTGKVAALAGVQVSMTPGKGVMLVYNQRMTDTVVNRCHMPSDGDIFVPIHTVAILGTTDVRVPEPEDDVVTRADVEHLTIEGEKIFPRLREMRLLRTYAGVRPLYQPPAAAQTTENRSVSRAHVVIDHNERDGVDNFVSIVGGKLTTYRLMAQDTVDVLAGRLGLNQKSTTAETPLPNQEKGKTYWLGHRLAEHEAEGGGDANLMCECEFVTRPMLDQFLAERWPCTFDDVRRGTRLGMGPCQGGFCTFRAAGLVAERGARAGNGQRVDPVAVDRAITGYLEERFKGTRPIAAGRQLQELWMVLGVYVGSLGIDSLTETAARESGGGGIAAVEAAHESAASTMAPEMEATDGNR